jgi:putative acetyltransferase
VAEEDGQVVGHILFSRLYVRADGKEFQAVALAPLAVDPSFHGTGIGGALIREAHIRLKAAGERLSIVLGDPAYYGRFGYSRERAAGFESAWQCAALQALAWGEAPESGVLVYASAFEALAA